MKYTPPAGMTVTSHDGSDFGVIYGLAAMTTGVTDGSNAAAGDIGEILEATVASGSAVPLTTATGKDVTTLALTPGDWDVSAVVDRALAGTTMTVASCGISLTANTLPSQPGGSGLGPDAAAYDLKSLTTVTGTLNQHVNPVRLSITANTTVHLVAEDTFSAGTVAAYGTIRARRVR